MPPGAATPPALDPEQVAAVQRALLAWYARHGRDLPWRHTRDPYAVLVSEVMLQQTQVDRVIPRWRAWLERFPTLADLAAAPRAEVIRAWRGLGYNLRAVRLHEVARQAIERFGGQLPPSASDLLSLKGIGRYSASAVACFAFGQSVPCVDTNVRRILGRAFLGRALVGSADDRAIESVAWSTLPADAYTWNQALMDLGAVHCTAARPTCLDCPLRDLCRAAPLMDEWQTQRLRQLREARAAYDSSARRRVERARYFRGRLVEGLRSLEAGAAVHLDELARLAGVGEGCQVGLDLVELARGLARDGLLRLAGQGDDPSALRVSLPE